MAREVLRVSDYETRIARLQTENASLRRHNKRLYERLRLLENAVRNAAPDKIHSETTPQERLLGLLRRVPKHPRKKYGWRK